MSDRYNAEGNRSDADPGEAPVQRKVIRPLVQASDGGIKRSGQTSPASVTPPWSQVTKHRSGWQLLAIVQWLCLYAVWTGIAFAV